MTEEFSRTEKLIGSEALDRLKKSSVIVFGLGGVGSYTVEALARAGVGSLTLVDGDTVSASNINRQLYALHSTLGMPKTQAAKERCLDINPACAVTVKNDFVKAENAPDFFTENYDYCVDAIDDTDAKTALALVCREKEIPLIAAMGTGNKLNPLRFRIDDISKTSYCPLCKTMRRKYREAGIDRVKVLWSDEPPASVYDNDEKYAKHVPASISYVPSAAGLIIAGEIIRDLAAIDKLTKR